MKLRILLTMLLLFGFSYAQESISAEEQAKREKNIQAGNPFKKYGYTPKIGTLSKGKYLEWHDLDTIVRIGSFLYHVKQKQLWAYDPISKNDKNALRPEISSRWISPDPLMEEFPEWSPYNFTLNNPIRFIDPDGRMAIPFDSGDCPPNCDTPNFWEQFKSSVAGFAKGVFGGQQDAQQLAESGNIEAAQKIDSKISQQVADIESYADAISIIPGAGLAEGFSKVENGDIGGGLLSLGLGILDVGTGGGASAAKTGAKVAAKSSGRVFWSGKSAVAGKAAENFARANGMKTLEMTWQGKALTRLTNATSYKFTAPLWNRASASFARGATGPVNVFHNASSGVRLNSVWRNVEYPILKGNNNIIYHNVFK